MFDCWISSSSDSTKSLLETFSMLYWRFLDKYADLWLHNENAFNYLSQMLLLTISKHKFMFEKLPYITACQVVFWKIYYKYSVSRREWQWSWRCEDFVCCLYCSLLLCPSHFITFYITCRLIANLSNKDSFLILIFKFLFCSKTKQKYYHNFCANQTW
jgi:hypothetical protein